MSGFSVFSGIKLEKLSPKARAILSSMASMATAAEGAAPSAGAIALNAPSSLREAADMIERELERRDVSKALEGALIAGAIALAAASAMSAGAGVVDVPAGTDPSVN